MAVPRKWWVLNPNRSAAMTDAALVHLRALPGLAAEWQGLTAADGPPVIADRASFEAGARAAQATLAHALEAAVEPPAGVLLACFGDPGLEALRAAWPGLPIEGLAQAAMARAAVESGRFAIVTNGPGWVPLLRERAAQFGFAEQLVGVYALPLDGRAFAADPARWQPALQAAARQARDAGAERLIAGGAVFAGAAAALLGGVLPLVDAFEAAASRLLRAGD